VEFLWSIWTCSRTRGQSKLCLNARGNGICLLFIMIISCTRHSPAPHLPPPNSERLYLFLVVEFLWSIRTCSRRRGQSKLCLNARGNRICLLFIMIISCTRHSPLPPPRPTNLKWLYLFSVVEFLWSIWTCSRTRGQSRLRLKAVTVRTARGPSTSHVRDEWQNFPPFMALGK